MRGTLMATSCCKQVPFQTVLQSGNRSEIWIQLKKEKYIETKDIIINVRQTDLKLRFVFPYIPVPKHPVPSFLVGLISLSSISGVVKMGFLAPACCSGRDG